MKLNQPDHLSAFSAYREVLAAERIDIDGRLVHPEAPHGQPAGYDTYSCRCESCVAAVNPEPESAAARATRAIRLWQRARIDGRIEVDGYLVHPDAEHGTVSAYSNWGCRCEPCRTANTIDTAERIDRRRAKELGHGVTGWRRGCRCVLCAAEKARTDRVRRRRAARRAVSSYQRGRVLAAIESGVHPVEAAVQAGVTWNQLLGLARIDRRWARKLDAALTAGRDPEISHGSYHSYQKHRCRCPECRAAKARYR